MEKRKVLDMSLGNPLHPFRSVARYAFQQAAHDLNKYRFMNRGHSDPEILPTYKAVSDFFTERGIYPSGWSGLPYNYFSLMGGGTTEGYNLITQLLIKDVMKENKRLNRDLKPAILMPMPTYGFFMHQPEQWGIKIVPVMRDLEKGGVVTKQELLRVVKQAHADDLRIISYFDSNPNNPLGTIRGEKETRALAEILIALRAHYNEQDKQALTLWQQSQPDIEMTLLDKPIKTKPGRLWEGPANRVRIIDDMVYDGLEYGDKKAFAFAQIDELFKDTFTLAGPSKAGLASLRGGVVIADSDDIYDLERLRINNNYFPSRPTLAALEAFYSTQEPFVTARRQHFNRLNRDHRFHGLFMKALINGIDTMAEAAPADKKKIIAAYATLESCTTQNAARKLKTGIKGVTVITTPEAGFFHVLDFSTLRGHTYQNPRNHWEDKKPFADDDSLIDMLRAGQDIQSCNASWMGLPIERLMSRATFAIPLADILEFAKRLQKGIQTLSPPEKQCCAAANPAPTL